MEYFKFGGVRGLLGLLVGTIQLILLSTLYVPSLQIGTQQFAGLSVGDTSAIGGFKFAGLTLLALFIVSITVSYLLSGLMYLIGRYIVEVIEIREGGFWKVAFAGVLGSLVVGVPIILALYFIMTSIASTGSLKSTYPVSMLSIVAASIPLSLIAEIGWAGVTWWVYKLAGWALPE